jgi:hypothetical protein
MSIQPGVGYNFFSSSSGTTIIVEPPFVNYATEGGGVSVPPIPAQLFNGGNGSSAHIPFEAWITEINGLRYLQISTGSCTFTRTNMPIIKTGAFSQTEQAWFRKVQICPEGVRTTYSEMWPNPSLDPEPSFSNTTMEDGGGYLLADTSDPLTLYAFKWDIGQAEEGFEDIPYAADTYKNLPTLALIAQSNSADTNKITVNRGPSLYEQTMNVQKMTGYTAEDTELPGDWGHCHTTWMNPRKVGFNSKAVLSLNPVSAIPFSATVSTTQVGIPGICNTIQTIRLGGSPSGGSMVISATVIELIDGVPTPVTAASVIPYFVTPVYTPLEVYGGDVQAMFNCLNSIVPLAGKVQVSGGNGVYHVTFLQDFQGLPMLPLTCDVSGVTSYAYDFEIIQYHVGDINLTTGFQPVMTQLMNKPDVTEAEDPYNTNKDSDPTWSNIVNIAEVRACKQFSGDVISDGVFIMGSSEQVNPELTIAAGCIPEPASEHPFKVVFVEEAEGSSTYRIVSGTVNNLVPVNIDDTIAVTGTCQVWLKVPYDSATNTFPYSSAEFTWNIGPTMPDDTDNFGYIRIAEVNGSDVTQYVTGSLWASRIKVGTLTAKYYYSRV